MLLNLSASNETIGKNKYRTDLVKGQSGRCIAAYAYASCGPTESTTDLVFGGHCLIAENGTLLAESPRVGDGGPMRRGSYWVTADIDIEHLQNDRRTGTALTSARRRHRADVSADSISGASGNGRTPSCGRSAPFVPKDDAERERRCAEIFGVQCAALASESNNSRPTMPLNIGMSGGLDSTLSLLVAVKMCDMLHEPRRRIHGLTMPGYGTTERTRTNALALMEHFGVSRDVIDIRPLCVDAFRAMGYRPFGIDPTSTQRRRVSADAEPTSSRAMS